MTTNQQGRQTSDGDYGQSRIFISANESSLYFEPGRESVTLAWSTDQSAIRTILSLLQEEVEVNRPEYAFLSLKPNDEYLGSDDDETWHNWREVLDKLSDTVTNAPDKVEFVRFDFTSHSIALSSVVPRYTLGIGYNIHRNGRRPRPADVQALRQAFLTTADPSIKIESELDWALESILT